MLGPNRLLLRIARARGKAARWRRATDGHFRGPPPDTRSPPRAGWAVVPARAMSFDGEALALIEKAIRWDPDDAERGSCLFVFALSTCLWRRYSG